MKKYFFEENLICPSIKGKVCDLYGYDYQFISREEIEEIVIRSGAKLYNYKEDEKIDLLIINPKYYQQIKRKSYDGQRFDGDFEFMSEIQFLLSCGVNTNKIQKCNPDVRVKGASLLDSVDDYIVVDIETTGLDPKVNKIIEISALKIKNREIIDKFSYLINPKCEIDDFITSLTGISNDDVKDASTIEEVLPEFLNFVGNQILVGHNISFDINFIHDNCINNNLNVIINDFVDTFWISQKVLNNMSSYSLKSVCKRFEIVNDNAHRALSDCKATYSCYEKLKDYIKENNIDIYKSKIHKSEGKASAKDITTENTEFDETSLIYKKVFAFTGALDKMTRKEAMQNVVDKGGINGDGVTKKTNFLVLGNNDYCKAIKDGKSSKHKKAEQLILKGQELQIISENVFYDMLDM